MHVALDNFCEGTHIGGIELLFGLGLKQNAIKKLHFGFWGGFFSLFNIMAVGCALGLRF